MQAVYMDPLVFDYLDFPNIKERDSTSRPAIRFVLEYKGTKMPYLGLVDSGADKSISFAIMGASLGIKFNESQLTPISGIGAEDEFAYKYGVNLIVDNHHILPVLIHWIQRPFNPNKDIPLIVGRELFAEFNITFKHKDKKLILEKN